MEKQLLDCLLANLIGFGKQLLPRGQLALSEEGQNAFFNILAEKMGTAEGIPLFSVPADTLTDAGEGSSQEKAAAGKGPVAASLDSRDISLLVSSLFCAADPPLATDKPFENKEVNVSGIVEFLHGVLEALSDGDEVELESKEKVDTAEALLPEKSEGNDQFRAGGQFMGHLMSLLHQLNRMSAQANEKETLPAGGQDVGAPQVTKPDPAVVNPDPVKETVKNIVNEDLEAPAFIVEVVKAAKKVQAQEISPKKDDRAQTAVQVPAAEGTKEAKDDLPIVSIREDAGADNRKEPKKIVIRLMETRQAQAGDDRDGRIIPQNDSPRQGVHQAAEAKGTVKNDFGAMMVDKIEKMTEQFAGRNLNMDMLVRLKIDEKETLLVGLKEEGRNVTVELKTTNESMMNFLQSQKEDITKSLEGKNIYTSIHVDLNQDAPGKRDKRDDRGDKDDDQHDRQDFSAFVEALA